MRVVVLGGDRRTAAMAAHLREKGIAVLHLAGDEGHTRAADMVASMSEARAIILPTPALTDDGYVFGLHTRVHARELFSRIGQDVRVFGGRISQAAQQLSAEYGVQLMDYMALEEVQLRNAIPSAEGAIMLAMQQLDVTIHGVRAAVLGYGRIGRVLAARLADWGAQVSVAVRRELDVVRLQCEGYVPLLLGRDTEALCNGYDVIFNTVPAHILPASLLARLPKSTLLIELASTPGGWSPDEATTCGLRCLYAPGLPAKYAPTSAGALIAEALLPYLAKKEVRGE